MRIETGIQRDLTAEEQAYYVGEAERVVTEWIHEALVDEANRRGFWAIRTDRETRCLAHGRLSLSDEELAVGLCRPGVRRDGRSLILAFQVLARGAMDWGRLVDVAREHGALPMLKWLATRTVTPRMACLLFRLRGLPLAEVDLHPDRFTKPYLRPLPA